MYTIIRVTWTATKRTVYVSVQRPIIFPKDRILSVGTVYFTNDPPFCDSNRFAKFPSYAPNYYLPQTF